MNISVNIRVRNPDWYWTEEETLESKKDGEMSREEWEAITEDKVKKHNQFVDFEYKFEVVNYTTNQNTSYTLSFLASETKDFINPTNYNIVLENVTVVEFTGLKEKGFVVVSNDIIHQLQAATKGKGARLYWYLYIKENVNYIKLFDPRWA